MYGGAAGTQNGQGLQRGQSLWSCDGRFHLDLQSSDGNLVLYWVGHGVLWATNKYGSGYNYPANSATMQGDGNFVQYVPTTNVWASNTANHSGAYLALQNDGNLVVYNTNRTPLWASNTCCH
jgi:hypothetical protein